MNYLEEIKEKYKNNLLSTSSFLTAYILYKYNNNIYNIHDKNFLNKKITKEYYLSLIFS